MSLDSRTRSRTPGPLPVGLVGTQPRSRAFLLPAGLLGTLPVQTVGAVRASGLPPVGTELVVLETSGHLLWLRERRTDGPDGILCVSYHSSQYDIASSVAGADAALDAS
jgi:hypothetical protein